MKGTMLLVVILALCASVFALSGAVPLSDTVSPSLPDLVPHSLRYYPLTPYAGDSVTVYSNVSNIGNSTAGAFDTLIHVTGTGSTDCIRAILSLAPGQNGFVSCTYTAYATNPNYVYVGVDYYGNVTESNEYNNGINGTIPVKFCGDGACNGNESYYSCPNDCPPTIYCGDGSCNGNETCSTCPSDCGACQNCTPSWFCRNGATRAYRSATCQVTYFPCSGNYCCQNGACVKDLANTCRNIVITDALSAETSMAQVKGPNEAMNLLAIFAMAALVVVVMYVFVKTETHM